MSKAPPAAAVVLAAGRGERLGVRPKALLELDGEPLIRRLIGSLQLAGVADVVVVTGHHGARIGAALQGTGARTVHNTAPGAAPTSSQRLGLAAVVRDGVDIVMALADQPLVGLDELAALFTAWERLPDAVDALYPLVGGQRGNPVVLAASARAEILAGTTDYGVRDWQAAHPGRVIGWPTDNTNYRIDIDTPDDIAAFERRTGRRLRWSTEPGA